MARRSAAASSTGTPTPVTRAAPAAHPRPPRRSPAAHGCGTSVCFRGWSGPGEGAELGGHAAGFGGADLAEDLLRLPQAGLRAGGVAGGQGAAAQARERAGLVPGAADL